MAYSFTKGIESASRVIASREDTRAKRFKQDRAEEIYDLAQKKKQDMVDSNKAVSQSEQESKQQQELNTLKEAQSSSNANQASVAMNQLHAANNKGAKSDAIDNANTIFKNNPQLSQSMGIHAPIENLDLNLPADKQYFTTFLGNLGVTPDAMGYNLDDPEDKKTWETLQNDMNDITSNVKTGGTFLDSDAVSIVAGTEGRATAKTKKEIKANDSKQQAVVQKAQNAQLDKNIARAKAKADKAGVYFDPSVLDTVDDKEDALEAVNKKIQQSAFRDPMAGETTTQLDYKGGTSGMPTTQAMVNGEMVDVASDGTIVDSKGKPIVTQNANGDDVTQAKGEKPGTTVTTNVATGESITTKDIDLTKPNSPKASENVEEVELAVQSMAANGLEADDTYMRHLYALAGKTYPIPDDTAKMKNYKFMLANGATNEQARKAIFPATKALTVTAKVQEYDALVKSGIDPKVAMGMVWKPTKESHMTPEQGALDTYKKAMAKATTEEEKTSARKAYIAELADVTKATTEQKDTTPTAKVQEVNNLVSQGKKLDEALDTVYGNKASADQIIADWIEAKGTDGYTNDELLEFSAAVRGKYEPKGSGDTDKSGKERRTKAHNFKTENKLDDPNTAISNTLINDSYNAGINTDKQANAVKTQKDDVSQLGNAMQKMTTFRKMVANESYSRDAIETMKTELRKVTTSEFTGMTVDEKKAHLDKVLTNSYGGQILADYMKSISGTAIADAEYKRLLDIFSGGTYSTKESYIAAIEGFTQGLEDTVENSADAIYLDDPGSALAIKQQVQTSRTLRKASEIDAPTRTHDGVTKYWDGTQWIR